MNKMSLVNVNVQRFFLFVLHLITFIALHLPEMINMDNTPSLTIKSTYTYIYTCRVSVLNLATWCLSTFIISKLLNF